MGDTVLLFDGDALRQKAGDVGLWSDLSLSFGNVVLRIYNVRRFSCWELFIFTPKTFARLVAGPAAQTLQGLGATMEWRLPPYRLSLDSARPTCPYLRKVHFILPCRQLAWDNCIGYVGHLLKISAPHLESLALDLSSFSTDHQSAEQVPGSPVYAHLDRYQQIPDHECFLRRYREGFSGHLGIDTGSLL